MNPTPTISVVIPARNSEQTLRSCLESVRASSVRAEEIIVVSDGSTDGTCPIAVELGAAVVELSGHHQANYCRNLGASRSTGDVVLFLDSDVQLRPDSIGNALQSLSDGNCDAVVGIYSVDHSHQNPASQYKNLWIRYSYLRSRDSVDWIFGAIAAIRRKAFEDAGGFDHTLFMHKGGDLELGKRIALGRTSIILNPAVEVEHLKRHTLPSLLRNDFERSQGFVQLAGRLGQIPRSLRRGFVNIYPEFAYSTLLSWASVAFLVIGIWSAPFLWIGLFSVAAHIALNWRFLSYFAAIRGQRHLPSGWSIMFLDHLVCGLGGLKGFVRWLLGNK